MINDKLENFYNENVDKKPPYIHKPKFESDFDTYQWIINDSGFPYWEVPLDIPYKEMYDEVLSIKDLFMDHRSNDPTQGGYSHDGWSSLTIHGISSGHTMNWDSYPEYAQLGDESKVPYKWTEISDLVPFTYKFLTQYFPHQSYMRVRFMKLKPGGYILPHRDREKKLLYPINIALNNPEGCEFVMEGMGIVPFEPGKGFMVDVSNRHIVWNKSNEDRIHLIVHWWPGQYHEDSGRRWAQMVNQLYIAHDKSLI